MFYKGRIDDFVRISFLIVLSIGWCQSAKNCTKDDVFVDIHPGDCTSYIECKHGKVEVKKCDSPTTHRFDHKLLKCVSNWPNKVDCESPSPWEKGNATEAPAHHAKATTVEPTKIVHVTHNASLPVVATTLKPGGHVVTQTHPTVSSPGVHHATKPTHGVSSTTAATTAATTAETTEEITEATTAPKPAATTRRFTSTHNKPGHKHESTTSAIEVTVTDHTNSTKVKASATTTSVSLKTVVVLILTVGVINMLR